MRGLRRSSRFTRQKTATPPLTEPSGAAVGRVWRSAELGHMSGCVWFVFCVQEREKLEMKLGWDRLGGRLGGTTHVLHTAGTKGENKGWGRGHRLRGLRAGYVSTR